MDAHDEELASAGRVLLGADVVELAGGVERLNGALDVTVPKGLAGREPASSIDAVADWIETRLLWARFGL